jgi:hypothetical protein
MLPGNRFQVLDRTVVLRTPAVIGTLLVLGVVAGCTGIQFMHNPNTAIVQGPKECSEPKPTPPQLPTSPSGGAGEPVLPATLGPPQ